MIVSIGGIKLNSRFGTVRFSWHALKALRDAKNAKGNLHAEIFRKSDVFYAYSVWEDEAAMRAYGQTRGHMHPVRKTKGIVASAINHSYESDHIPEREAVVAAWTDSQG